MVLIKSNNLRRVLCYTFFHFWGRDRIRYLMFGCESRHLGVEVLLQLRADVTSGGLKLLLELFEAGKFDVRSLSCTKSAIDIK